MFGFSKILFLFVWQTACSKFPWTNSEQKRVKEKVSIREGQTGRFLWQTNDDTMLNDHLSEDGEGQILKIKDASKLKSREPKLERRQS